MTEEIKNQLDELNSAIDSRIAKAEGQAVALLGRVPVKIVGKVSKGDPIWPATNGCGCTVSNGREPFAFALADGEDSLVECIVRR